VKKLRIGYWPLSPSLSAPGDRRRLVHWANARGHTIVTDLNTSVDLIVASENADFNSSYFFKNSTPIILDLVDAYLSPSSTAQDIGRGFMKFSSGRLSGTIKPFSSHIADFCKRSNAVICSSVEQEELIKPYTKNTHVILDSHEEIPFSDPRKIETVATSIPRILWEGQPATLAGIKTIAPALLELSNENSLHFDFVTDEKYFLIMNRYFERSTLELLHQFLGQIRNQTRIIPWSANNLAESARKSSMAIIPIDLSVPMQRLKPENRLLIMWRLGLPCLTSASPAYSRVSRLAGVEVVCSSIKDWKESFNRVLDDSNYGHEQVLAGQQYLRDNHNDALLLSKWDVAVDSVMG
jgi:hypothetical protein